jgi:phospholipase D1/2
VQAESSVQTIMAAQYRTINRGGKSIYETIRAAGFEPYVAVHMVRGCNADTCTLGSTTFVSTTFALTIVYMLLSVSYMDITRKHVLKLLAETLIPQMEEKSGIKFQEARVALARQWMGEVQSSEGWVPTEVEIRIPQETGEGIVVSDKTQPTTEKIKIPENEQEARRIIEQFEATAREGDLARAQKVSDNVVQHMLTDVTDLNQEDWQYTEEEELQS